MRSNKILLISLSLIYSTNVFSHSESHRESDATTVLSSPPITDSVSPTPQYTYMSDLSDMPVTLENISSFTKTILDRGFIRFLSVHDDGGFNREYIEAVHGDRANRSPVISTFSNGKKAIIFPEHIFNEIIKPLENIDSNSYNQISNSRVFQLNHNIVPTPSIVSMLHTERTKLNNTNDNEGDLINDIDAVITMLTENLDPEQPIYIIKHSPTSQLTPDSFRNLLARMDQSAKRGELLSLIKDSSEYIQAGLSNNQEKLRNQEKKLGDVEVQTTANTSDIKNQGDMLSSVQMQATTNEDKIAAQETQLTDVESRVAVNEDKIENQEAELDSVKQTANGNKEIINEQLVNSFASGGNSSNVKGHIGALYTSDVLNRSRITALENNFEHFKHETNNRFYKVEKRANQGIASVAAMSNLPFNDAATFSTALGVGNYRNATAFAWGMQYRINNNVKVKASTAWNESNNWVSAGGVGISW